MKLTAATSYIIVIGMALSCGRKDDNSATTTDDLSVDSTTSKEVVQSNVQDSLEALGEESSSSAALTEQDYGLALAGTSISKTCAVEGNNAKVSLTSEISKDVSVTTANRSLKRTLSGKGEQVRLWSKSGSSVACASNAKVANIDWKNVDGLGLQLSFSRSRAASETISNLKKGTSVTRSASFTASGTRTIAWTQSTSADTSSSVVRNKSITSSVVRTFSVTKSSGEQQDLKLTTEVLAAAPLKVTVTRASSDLALQSKLINSGTVIATNKDGGKVESAFSSLLVNYKDGNCTPQSGSIVSKFFAKDATSPSKTLTTTFDQGVGTIVDENSQEVGTVEINGCDPEDAGA